MLCGPQPRSHTRCPWGHAGTKAAGGGAPPCAGRDPGPLAPRPQEGPATGLQGRVVGVAMGAQHAPRLGMPARVQGHRQVQHSAPGQHSGGPRRSPQASPQPTGPPSQRTPPLLGTPQHPLHRSPTRVPALGSWGTWGPGPPGPGPHSWWPPSLGGPHGWHDSGAHTLTLKRVPQVPAGWQSVSVPAPRGPHMLLQGSQGPVLSEMCDEAPGVARAGAQLSAQGGPWCS